MVRSALGELPTETLEHIGLFLGNVDGALLGLTCKRFYIIFPTVHSPIYDLPWNIHQRIEHYLNDVDGATLALTCKHLHDVYSAVVTAPSKLIHLLQPDCQFEAAGTRSWLKRMDLMSCLHSWLPRVDRQGRRSRPEVALDTRTLALCIGCAQYRYVDADWVGGDVFGDICYGRSMMWQKVWTHVMKGQFCGRCSPPWTILTAALLRDGRYSSVAQSQGLDS